ncbi:hypothetical protein [Paenibacillus sp. NPDC093718]|uniref:hypothetical protein n=1 Tax=Paenibacillus sp. NPDC093718 TaxID=3390601 RepID=UPI003CFE6E55
MKKLNRMRFEQARQYMLHQSRNLERSLFRYDFENGAFKDVLTELDSYQNEDGGYGHGLEPDLRCKESSALATTRALEILRLIPDHPERNERVISALKYLELSYVPERSGWDIIPKEAEQSPRAIWWQYGAFKDHWGNPNADIIAYFIDERELYPLEFLESRIDYAVNYLKQSSDLHEMHELFCYLRLNERLPKEQASEIGETLEIFMDNCISRDPGSREGYGATPLSIMDSPDSPYFAKYHELLPLELDVLIGNQGEDGAWEPNWSWYQYEEVWPLAKEEWKGVLTWNALRTLRNFERIEGI